MEDTNCGENCAFFKSGFCLNEKECPNYTETIWEEAATGKTKVVKDCAPKRTMMEQQRAINSITAMHGAFQKLKEKVESLETMLFQIINASKKFLQEQEEIKQIEKKNED